MSTELTRAVCGGCGWSMSVEPAHAASANRALLEHDCKAENLRATVSTLLGRIEALERTVSAMREREQAIRRAVGQLAHAYDIVRK